MISDLRDLYILQEHRIITPLKEKDDEKSIVDSYKEEIRKEGKIKSETFDKIADLALRLNNEAKAFSVSSSILAAREVMRVVHSNENHRIYKLFSFAKGDDIVRVERFYPCIGTLGYRIVIPQDVSINYTETNSCNITKGIGALLLGYHKIKNHESASTNIDEILFKNEWEDIKNFSNCLSKAKAKHLKDFARSKIKSKERIQKIITK